jgi:hypothetical protein
LESGGVTWLCDSSCPQIAQNLCVAAKDGGNRILFISEQKVQALVGPIEYVFLHLAQNLFSGLAHDNDQLQETTLFFFINWRSNQVAYQIERLLTILFIQRAEGCGLPEV